MKTTDSGVGVELEMLNADPDPHHRWSTPALITVAVLLAVAAALSVQLRTHEDSDPVSDQQAYHVLTEMLRDAHRNAVTGGAIGASSRLTNASDCAQQAQTTVITHVYPLFAAGSVEQADNAGRNTLSAFYTCSDQLERTAQPIDHEPRIGSVP